MIDDGTNVHLIIPCLKFQNMSGICEFNLI
jgi:hypothetical protein